MRPHDGHGTPSRTSPILGGVGRWLCPAVLLVLVVVLGCEVRLRPIVHLVEYRSEVTCAPDSASCPWRELEEQARFGALVNCLLAGATVLERDTGEAGDRRLAPTPPRYGFERQVQRAREGSCPSREVACLVASRHAQTYTWAGCAERPWDGEPLRGGPTPAEADELTESTVVTGALKAASNAFPEPTGLDGPDHFYQIRLTRRTRLEVAVATNSSAWSPTKGHRSPWQPGLYLLDVAGTVIEPGRTFWGRGPGA